LCRKERYTLQTFDCPSDRKLINRLVMPHYCRVCDRYRANEKFTGRGHRNHVCKDCQRLPPEERDRIERLDELYAYLNQSNISPRNVARLDILIRHGDSEITELAGLVLDVARVKPHKKRRWKFLAQNHPTLLKRLKMMYGDWVPEEVWHHDEILEESWFVDDIPEEVPDSSESSDVDLPF
jgi:hypothetical protein